MVRLDEMNFNDDCGGIVRKVSYKKVGWFLKDMKDRKRDGNQENLCCNASGHELALL